MPTTHLAASGAHLLIVDDDTDQLRLLIEGLRAANYRLSVAFDIIQAYERACAALPELVLMDAGASRADGLALYRRLKANPATSSIPVFFLCGADDMAERLAGLHDGGVDYIIKPYQADEVVARIQIHLGLAVRKSALVAGAEAPLGDEVLVRAAKRHLQATLGETPRLDELAVLLGVNERRLSRAFRKLLGMTVFEYLRQERMRVAERLLTQTSLSMAAISEEIGFSSAANFSTAFREHAGISPSNFRRTSPGYPLQDGSAVPPSSDETVV